LLDAIGFVSGGAHQSAATVNWLRAGYTLVPFALLAVGSLFLREIRTSSEPEQAIGAATQGGRRGTE